MIKDLTFFIRYSLKGSVNLRGPHRTVDPSKASDALSGTYLMDRDRVLEMDHPLIYLPYSFSKKSNNMSWRLWVFDRIGVVIPINSLKINYVYFLSGGTEDWLEIYDDVDYSTTFETIKFEQGDLTKLGDKIKTLSQLEGKIIDVFVSRRWKIKDVGYLTRILEKNSIRVRKFIYLGSKANRFLFSTY